MKARGFLMSLEARERKKCWTSTHPENCRRPENVPKFCVYTVSLQTCLSTKYIDVTICKLIKQWHVYFLLSVQYFFCLLSRIAENSLYFVHHLKTLLNLVSYLIKSVNLNPLKSVEDLCFSVVFLVWQF